jgi:type II secretory pathway pseudopilin PulG
MDLAGQFWIRGTASPRTPSRPRSRGPSFSSASSRRCVHAHSRSDDRGYILVALLIGIAIASVWMSAALPSWRQQATREKEAELAFRGEQYARAIYLYSQKMNGALPSNFDDLVSQHTLRYKWKDPITGDEFLPRVGCQGGVPGGGVPGGVPGRGNAPGVGTTPGGPGNPTPVAGGRVGQTPPVPGGRVTAPGGQTPGFGQGGQPGQGGICGVQSKSKAASIRLYNGQQEYDLWQFDTLTASLQFTRNIAKLSGGAAAGQGMGLPLNSPGGGRGIQSPGTRPGVPPTGGGGRDLGPGGFPGPSPGGRGPGPGGPGTPGGGRGIGRG